MPGRVGRCMSFRSFPSPTHLEHHIMADLTLGMKSTILSTSLSLSAAGALGAFAAHSDLRVIAPAWGHM